MFDRFDPALILSLHPGVLALGVALVLLYDAALLLLALRVARAVRRLRRAPLRTSPLSS